MAREVTGHTIVNDPDRPAEHAGTPRYMAPELLDARPRFSDKVDVYAFGMTLYQLVTGRLPMDDLLDHLVSRYVTEHNRRPEIPGGMDELSGFRCRCIEDAAVLLSRTCHVAGSVPLSVSPTVAACVALLSVHRSVAQAVPPLSDDAVSL